MDSMGLALAVLLVLYLYPFAGYPLLLRLVAPRRRRPAPEPGAWPEAALIICALNEQTVIADKIENSLALDYEPDKLRIVVISDGSTDRTAEIARAYRPRIELIEQPRRRGKVANLNEAIAGRREEIIVLSDANVLYDRAAARKLVAGFCDPKIGAVSGRVILVETAPAIGGGEQGYYSIEWDLQERESELYSMVGADGAMYAFRRELFAPCPDDTLIEDLVIPMSMVRRGFRVMFAPGAVGWEQGARSAREEFARRVRIAAGAAQALVRGSGWPSGAPAVFWWIFLSHKLLRWLSPFLGGAAVAVALFDWVWPPARAVVLLAALLGLAALTRPLWPGRNAALEGAFYFLLGQAALAWGFVKGLAGRQSVLWAKRDR